MDFINGQGGGAQRKSKVRNLASSIITVLFSLYFHRQVSIFYFAKGACFQALRDDTKNGCVAD